MRVSHIIHLHLFDIFGIRDRNENVLSRNTKCLSKHFLDINDVLQDFENQHSFKSPVPKREG